MARMISEIPESYDAIARPVAYDITREVGQLMHLPKVTEILFNGPSEQGVQTGSTLDYSGAPTKFPGGSRISVAMAETSNEPNTLAESALQENAPVIMLDSGLGVRLRPVYASTMMTLSFNIRSRGRVEAGKIRDEFRVRSAMGRQQLLHTLTYNYSIPDDQMVLLKQIWTMREAVAGYGEDFDTWLRATSSPRLSTLTTQVGDGALYAFGENQIGVQGTFDFEVSPEAPDKADPDGQYNYPIEYKVRYDKVVAMSLDFQLVVHNQMLPAQFHGPFNATGITPQPYASPAMYSDKTNSAFRQLFQSPTLRPSPMDGVRFPPFDDWIPRAVPPNTSTVYTCILAIDPADPCDVIDLMQLEGVTIVGAIVQYMATQGKKLANLNLSAIHVAVFKNQGWLGDEAITVSTDLKVRTVDPMCLRDRYHLRVSLLNDLGLLPDDDRFILRSQGLTCQKILLTLQQKLHNGQYVPKLAGKGVVPDAVLMECINRINQYSRIYATGLERRMLTVDNFFLNVKRLSDNADHETSGPKPATDISTNPNYEPVVSGGC